MCRLPSQAGSGRAGGASRPRPGTRIGSLPFLLFAHRRRGSSLLPGTTADPAPTDVSDAKRARADPTTLTSTSTPTPVDYASLFSEEGARRRLAGLREIVAAAAGRPGVVGLHGGFPPPDAFPFVRLTATLKDGTTVEVSDPEQVCGKREREGDGRVARRERGDALTTRSGHARGEKHAPCGVSREAAHF